MTFRYADRVKVTAAAPGTGSVTANAPVTGFIGFNSIPSIANNDTVPYVIWDGAANYEIGVGTYQTSGTVVARTAGVPAGGGVGVSSGSAGAGTLVNFAAAVTMWCAFSAAQAGVPTQQKLTSGTAATYTTPSGCQQLRVRMYGGGGGGGGAGTGGNGGDTIFNGVHAGGGGGAGLLVGSNVGPGGAGGTSSTGTANVRLAGAVGGGFIMYCAGVGSFAMYGGVGGGGGGSLGGTPGNNGTAGLPNTGSGGGGGGQSAQSTTSTIWGGGGQGEYVELIINQPAGTYTYTIGAGGAGGTSSGSTGTGGAGGTGVIVVDEIY